MYRNFGIARQADGVVSSVAVNSGCMLLLKSSYCMHQKLFNIFVIVIKVGCVKVGCSE